MIAESPTPHLPRGAGGSPRRAAGRVFPPEQPQAAAAALVLEPDPLARLLVVAAVAALGFRVLADPDDTRRDDPPSAAAVVFVPLSQTADCRWACTIARARAGAGVAPLVAGYAAGPPALLAAHRAHRCADLVLLLTAAAGRACFAHLPAADEVSAAGFTVREADVLVLLLGGLTTPGIARRLCISPSTARTHCRAVLRKLGTGDRRALRARLLAGPDAAAPSGSAEPPPDPRPCRPGRPPAPAPRFA